VQRRGRLLLVSYYFPPAGGVASTRVAKLAKYLARLGWDVHALSGPPGTPSDASLLRDVRDVATIVVAEHGRLPAVHGLGWVAAILPTLRREAAKADVLLVSGAPFLPFIGATLVRPWAPYVVDARDLWAAEPRFGRTRGGARRRGALHFEQIAESVSLRRAAAVVTVAPELAAIFKESHPALAERIEVIPHGFDPDDLPASPPAPDEEAPSLLHAGTMLVDERTPELIVETARHVRAAGVPLAVRLLGSFDERLRGLVEGPSAEGWLTVEPPVDHAAAVAAAASASVLWLEPGPYDFAVTGKVYEYVASGRPVVVAAPETNAAARIVARAGGGIVAGTDPQACAKAVQAALAGDVPSRDATVIAALSLPHIVERLDEILRAVAR
jgi:glycosyltransferase involved in cell wall biosynthesis